MSLRASQRLARQSQTVGLKIASSACGLLAMTFPMSSRDTNLPHTQRQGSLSLAVTCRIRYHALRSNQDLNL